MGMIFAFFGGMVGLGLTVLWVFAILEIVRSEFVDRTERLTWLLLVMLLPFIGTILYILIGRKLRLNNDSDIL
ncbi:MAG: PLDc N-terminal domain-containing protein [Sinomicrobium sp.]|nr:PLDc N-terminal domain-containing protein [Sinomicrobium sp.]